MYALVGHKGQVLGSNQPFRGCSESAKNLPIFGTFANIMLGAYFKVARRARKARIGPKPCGAYLRATSNAREVALEGTKVGRSIKYSEAVDFERRRRPRMCRCKVHMGVASASNMYMNMRMAPLRRNSHARGKGPRVSKSQKSPCAGQFAVPECLAVCPGWPWGRPGAQTRGGNTEPEGIPPCFVYYRQAHGHVSVGPLQRYACGRSTAT